MAVKPFPPNRILVIEDEPEIAEMLTLNLEAAGFRVEATGDGATGLAIQERDPADLIVLDLMLPKVGGFEVLHILRRRHDAVPILILTARTGDADRIQGLSRGADDYLGKPFSVLELIARIHAILRRTHNLEAQPRVLRSGPFRINLLQLVVHRGRSDLNLTLREFRLLEVLVSNPGRINSRQELLNMAWDPDGKPMPRTVDVHIGTLRKKLGDSDKSPFIQTLDREGYRWMLPVVPEG
ncbi:response regulator transcription factor [Mesoterricola silvestris]|uniref:DNA-binding response regulator n=1 Tax=Mesoterricola silvestris TaxID=2927979 RepID=A0AA48KBV8_9BACT|nr:response regulator transcription factor [Mesoterricola silvestris]BDU74722.1 DNA-binding response regulator [Mesoterricola silvestris]